jgi:hypothetical protein
MKLGRKLLVLAAFAALAAFGAAPALAHDDPAHHGDPTHPGSCWDITKVATDSHGTPISELTLSLGQTYTIYYEITVTERDCLAHETPHESVDVKDTFGGVTTVLAIHLDHSQTFNYTRDITAHSCDPFDVENTAEVWNSIVLDSASVTILVNVACDQGCTLTQGYWKTHSEFGPAPYDNTWALLPNGASTTFFLSGTSWFNVFWTAPAGNVYYQLAHQYMAAVLNKLNGASSTSAVDAAITAAEGFFNTYTPAQAGALGKTSAARTNALAWAGTLGSYNEGAIGPGHCDEDDHA